MPAAADNYVKIYILLYPREGAALKYILFPFA